MSLEYCRIGDGNERNSAKVKLLIQTTLTHPLLPCSPKYPVNNSSKIPRFILLYSGSCARSSAVGVEFMTTGPRKRHNVLSVDHFSHKSTVATLPPPHLPPSPPHCATFNINNSWKLFIIIIRPVTANYKYLGKYSIFIILMAKTQR